MKSVAEITDSARRADWDDRVLATEGYSVFHCAGWARSLSESYRYTPRCFFLRGEGGFEALLPLMEIRSPFTGSRGVSLPFTDFCEPLYRDADAFRCLFDAAIQYGRKAGWKYIEWRGGNGGLPDAPANESHLFHVLDLQKPEREIFSGFRGSTRRNIKKAVKQGVEVRISRTRADLDEFCRLNILTRKNHGIPPQPSGFFKNLFEQMISRGNGFVSLAEYRRKPVAGAVFLHFGNKAVYKYGASDPDTLEVRPNNLVIWEGIRRLARNGFHELDFGRTEPHHSGLLQFKRGWGAEEETRSYYQYHLKREGFIGKRSKTGVPVSILSKFPASLLSLAGKLLYRHMG